MYIRQNTFSFKKMYNFKMSYAKVVPFCYDRNAVAMCYLLKLKIPTEKKYNICNFTLKNYLNYI